MTNSKLSKAIGEYKKINPYVVTKFRKHVSVHKKKYCTYLCNNWENVRKLLIKHQHLGNINIVSKTPVDLHKDDLSWQILSGSSIAFLTRPKSLNKWTVFLSKEHNEDEISNDPYKKYRELSKKYNNLKRDNPKRIRELEEEGALNKEKYINAFVPKESKYIKQFFKIRDYYERIVITQLLKNISDYTIKKHKN